MKYIFLTGSIIFGIAGICQTMDAFMGDGLKQIANSSAIVYNLQYFTLSFVPTPGFVKVFLLSFGFFSMFVIWKKLKKYGVGKPWD